MATKAQREPTYLDLQARIGIIKHNGGYPATDRLLAPCHVREGSEVLYVGSGIGVGPAHLASTCGCRVVAVDISPQMLEWTRIRVRREHVAHLVTRASWRALWEGSGLVDQAHEWHDLDIAEETRSRLAWIGWRWLLPAWGRVLKLVVTDPTVRRALRAQVSYPASLVNEMG